ncbi:MAG: M15 family metallopeptidase [Coprobacillus sp.]|nr:M15 family metallopeptidase [Coprobacillus sp.]
MQKIEKEPLKLKHQRIQLAQNSQIDYLSYISGNDDQEDIQYNSIDSSQLGTYQVVYKKADSNEKQTLTIDIVKMYENGIYSPKSIQATTIKNPEDVTSLVNKTHQIPKGWIPDDLVNVIDSHQQLRKEAAQAYKEFYLSAQDKGIKCYAISGYRTNETQSLYWKRQVQIYGEEYASQYSAYPGRSEHQLGLAIDVSNQLTGDRLSEKVAQAPIGKFIVSDGYKYGFILRYPQDKVSITNYGYEPWHMRYVGKELAKKLHDTGLTLEEYMEKEQSQ